MIFLLYWLFALVAIARAVADDVSHGTIGINEAAFLKGIVVAEAPVPHSAHIPVHVTFLQVVSDRQNVSSSHIEEIDTVFADWQPGGTPSSSCNVLRRRLQCRRLTRTICKLNS
jgi:hypothetical protein